MATGSNVGLTLAGVTSAPTNGSNQQALVSFGGSQVLQGCTNIFVDVVLSDPTNTGSPATFEIDIVGGIQTTQTVLGTITEPGLATIVAPSAVTNWQANLISLSGGTAPTITVRGLAGE